MGGTGIGQCMKRDICKKEKESKVCREVCPWSIVWRLFEKVKVLVTQSCPILCNLLDYSPPASSVHGILQARILEWVAIPFFRGSSWPRDWTWVSHVAGKFFTVWDTRKADKKLSNISITERTERSFWPYELSWR